VLSAGFILFLSALYLGLLFAVARFGDARADAGKSIISANVYALSLAVYCTSWTFYGSVGRATSGGLSFLTLYIGPTLMLLFVGVIIKMIRISKAQRITSIADFIASRYGKSQLLAGLVTVIAVIGVVPYIALQLKAVAASLDVLLDRSGTSLMPAMLDSTFLIAALLAVFTILFGTRHLDATERHEGMVAAIAFESVVKLLAFLAVGLFVTYGMFGGLSDLFQRAAAAPELARLLHLDSSRAGTWTALILLSGLAIIFLPRQFQIIVVENVDESHLRRAVWLFPLYLLLINIFVLPLALGGLLHFPGQPFNADTFVLTLPLSRGAEALALLVFIGGLSAATGMVIVETIALSTMVCNDLVMPWLLRSRWFGVSERRDLSGLLIGIRRAAIVVILLLGYIYFRAAGEAYALVGIGLISFAAVAQFAPAMFGGMYWKQGTRAGAVAGLLGGFAVWLYTLLLPSFARSGWIDRGFVEHGLWGIQALKAQALFGLSGLDEISHSLWPNASSMSFGTVRATPTPGCGAAPPRPATWLACSNVFLARCVPASNWRVSPGRVVPVTGGRCRPMPSSCASPRPSCRGRSARPAPASWLLRWRAKRISGSTRCSTSSTRRRRSGRIAGSWRSSRGNWKRRPRNCAQPMSGCANSTA
jgi:Na+/proline symporter